MMDTSDYTKYSDGIWGKASMFTVPALLCARVNQLIHRVQWVHGGSTPHLLRCVHHLEHWSIPQYIPVPSKLFIPKMQRCIFSGFRPLLVHRNQVQPTNLSVLCAMPRTFIVTGCKIASCCNSSYSSLQQKQHCLLFPKSEQSLSSHGERHWEEYGLPSTEGGPSLFPESYGTFYCKCSVQRIQRSF